jgi:hypothetical protein
MIAGDLDEQLLQWFCPWQLEQVLVENIKRNAKTQACVCVSNLLVSKNKESVTQIKCQLWTLLEKKKSTYPNFIRTE